MFKRNRATIRSRGSKPFNFLTGNQTDFVFDTSAKSVVWQRVSRILSEQNPKPKPPPQTFSTSRRIIRIANNGATSLARVQNFQNFISGVMYENK